MDDSEMDSAFYSKGNRYCQETTQSKPVNRLDEVYEMSNPKRGLAVIIVNSIDYTGTERIGWDIDLENLKKLFSNLGFELRTFCNYTKAKLLKSLYEVSREDHSGYGCFALAVSSHGGQETDCKVREDMIFTLDQPVKTRAVLEIFTDKKCPGLAGKPKLFFIQACRGDELDDGVELKVNKTMRKEDMPDANPIRSISSDYRPYTRGVTTGGRQVCQEAYDSEPVVKPAPCYKDFLVMYATPPGHFAFRRLDEGSWFVTSLVEVLLKSDGSRNLTQQLTQVCGRVALKYTSKSRTSHFNSKKQTPVIYSRLCKDVYLGPVMEPNKLKL